jgi:hypothetical protein
MRSLFWGGASTNSSAWNNIPANNTNTLTITPETTLGDPCQYWFGGDWFLPSAIGTADPSNSAARWWTEYDGSGNGPFPQGSSAQWLQRGGTYPINGAMSTNGDWKTYVSAGGYRGVVDDPNNRHNIGVVLNYEQEAIYWSSQSDTAGAVKMSVHGDASVVIGIQDRGFAFGVRCVRTSE